MTQRRYMIDHRAETWWHKRNRLRERVRAADKAATALLHQAGAALERAEFSGPPVYAVDETDMQDIVAVDEDGAVGLMY